MRSRRTTRLPPRRQLTTAQRGYGSDHQRLRAKLKAGVDTGTVICWRCGQRIGAGENWDLGHADTPAAKALRAYRGPEHRYCSRSAGALKKQCRAGIKMPLRSKDATPARALAFFDTGHK